MVEFVDYIGNSTVTSKVYSYGETMDITSNDTGLLLFMGILLSDMYLGWVPQILSSLLFDIM